MPRIAAANIAEHVARQESAVFEAAVRLFVERGFHEVSLADIASDVGLKRNSLYRYFPDKAHILARWLASELPEQAERSAELLTGSEDPADRLERWIDAQLAYAATPEHGLIAALADVAPQLDEETRAELADSHERMLAPLAGLLGELGVPEADVPGVVSLLGALVIAAARAPGGAADGSHVRRRLSAAVRGLLST